MRFEGTAEELHRRNTPVIEVEVDDLDTAVALLARHGIASRVEHHSVLMTPPAQYGPAEINALLVRAGIQVSRLVTRHLTLEDTFLELTSTPAPATTLVEAR